jgi:GT2 family glycosyltransferase
MPLTPLYSVVVPTCGRVALFRETLACIAKQTHPRIELLVPDDSPQADDREQIRRAVEDFQAATGHVAKYIFSGARLYQAANTNQGLAASTGELVRILHSDDLLRPDALAQEAAVFAQFANVDLLYQDCIPFVDDITWDVDPRTTLVQPALQIRTEASHSTALPSGIAFRRELVARTGFMDEQYRFLCDWDFFCRLLLDQTREQKLVCRLSPGLFGWRRHPDSVTSTLWQLHYEEHERFIRNFVEQPELAELGILSAHEKLHFVKCAVKYRMKRLSEDFHGLPGAQKRRSCGWLAQKCFDLGGSDLRKQVGRSLERRVRRLLRGKKSTATTAPGEATQEAQRNAFGSLAENQGTIAVAPCFENRINDAHATTIVMDYDNSAHLWNFREELATARTVRLFYVNYTRMYERVLHEVLKYVAIGSEIEILLGGNEHLQWFGLKAVVDRIFPNEFVLSTQENIEGDFYSITFRRQQPTAEHLRQAHTGWTFGLLTLGTDRDRVLRYVQSIEQSSPGAYEILVVAPQELDWLAGVPRVRQLIFNERDDRGWITRKKNLICEEAKFSDILICHDRFELAADYFAAWERWGYSYGIAAPRVVLRDGRRGLDWAVASSQNDSWSHGGLLDYRAYSHYAYVPGGATALRKAFWQRFPWNENLYWNEHEDVELCRRAQRDGELIHLTAASVIASADRWIEQNPLIPYNPHIETLYGGPVGEQRIAYLPFPKTVAA